MKKILFVEDDVLIARVYSQKLSAEGFDVKVAEDGLAAMKLLPQFKPDLVVLDLLMPKFTGVDVLKFMRQNPDFKQTRVVVFSNSFLSDLIEQVAQVGVEEALVKAAVTPARLTQVINSILENPAPALLTSDALASRLAGAVSPGEPPKGTSAAVTSQTRSDGATNPDTDFAERVQHEFLERSHVIFKSVRGICSEFIQAADSPMEPRKLEDLGRKIGFLTQMLAMAERPQLAQLCSALEALLFDMQEKPKCINDSSRHTIASTVVFLEQRLDGNKLAVEPRPARSTVLVIDDDAVSSRAVVLALGRANLSAKSITDPFDGIRYLQENACDLVLLDINMPGMDGLMLCEQMRRVPAHRQTPVIFFTAETDYKTHLRSILSGGNDLIIKPVLPTELCVKAITHLLRARTDAK